jgi:hypothetical protein
MGTRDEHKAEFHRSIRRALDLVDEQAELGTVCSGGTERLAEAMRWVGIAQANLFQAPPSESANAAWGLTRQTQKRILDGLRLEAGAGCFTRPTRPRRSPQEEDAFTTGEMAILRGLGALRRGR